MSQALPNPAIDAFKSRLTSQTSINDALILGREQFKKALRGKESLYAKWRNAFSYICAVVCIWACVYVIEVSKLFPEEGEDAGAERPGAETILILSAKHIVSALILFLLGIAPHLPGKFRTYQSHLKRVTLLLGLLEVIISVAGTKVKSEEFLAPRKLAHYPLGGILAIVDYLQEIFMDADMKRSRTRFKELDEGLKAMAGKKS